MDRLCKAGALLELPELWDLRGRRWLERSYGEDKHCPREAPCPHGAVDFSTI
jgi:hypothetical protein